MAMNCGPVDHAVQSPVITLIVFDIDGQRYALPLHDVERVLPMVAVSPLPQAPAVVLGVMNLHGQVIPVLDLRRHFGLPIRDYGLTARLLVIRTSRRILTLAVDEVLGVREIAQETITRPDALLSGIGHVAGIVTLADGLLFIHDVEACLSLDEEQRLTTALEGIGV
ncbi:chemotaxis protein CheW [Candidatus Methylomirabilis sp.]|uniref:chemotaxis protein CheW n=1 Tax=Candidatus Methylomirabilis sp. TaxID=2032687 RepID=UPI002A66592F|nr:chemotaxis protein CheW [Candidatus Methylomirabilis sp.]